ncbi:unnamed protein product [Bathycoccus prasinos]
MCNASMYRSLRVGARDGGAGIALRLSWRRGRFRRIDSRYGLNRWSFADGHRYRHETFERRQSCAQQTQLKEDSRGIETNVRWYRQKSAHELFHSRVTYNGEYTERWKWKVRTTEGKSYITDAGEQGTTKTCLYCGKWNLKLKMSDKDFTCRGCGQEYRRAPGSAMHNTMEGCQARQDAREEAREEAQRAAGQAEGLRRKPSRVCRRVQ